MSLFSFDIFLFTSRVLSDFCKIYKRAWGSNLDSAFWDTWILINLWHVSKFEKPLHWSRSRFVLSSLTGIWMLTSIHYFMQWKEKESKLHAMISFCFYSVMRRFPKGYKTNVGKASSLSALVVLKTSIFFSFLHGNLKTHRIIELKGWCENTGILCEIMQTNMVFFTAFMIILYWG